MAKLTIKKLIGFLKVGVLQTTTAIKEFPRREITQRMQRAMVTPILCSAILNVNGQLGSFLNAFMN